MPGKNILLLEPGYKNKYPPLGLMKIAQYHGRNGKNDNVKFAKGIDHALKLRSWDRIYITTLFSFEYPNIAETIEFALDLVQGQSQRIFVGGIAASLMHSRFLSETRWRGIRFIRGLLDQAPAVSLQLRDHDGDLYAGDVRRTPLADIGSDARILDPAEDRYPGNHHYFAY